MKIRYDIKEKDTLAYRLIPGETRSTMARNGAIIHYSRLPAKIESVGTVVLLHGVASNGSRWEEFVETSRMSEYWDIVRMDLRGHAASVCSGKACLEDWCSDIAAVLDELGVEKAALVGHSLGAQVAMNFAARMPERTLALALLDPLVSEALTKKALDMRSKVPMLRMAESVTRAMNRIGFVRKIIPQDLRASDNKAREKIAKGGKELEEFIEQYSSTKTDLQYIHLAAYLRDLQEVGRESPAPELIRCRTLVIGASSGTFTDPQAMSKWCEKIGNARMEIVTCAHWPMTECPEQVGGALERWIDEVRGSIR